MTFPLLNFMWTTPTGASLSVNSIFKGPHDIREIGHLTCFKDFVAQREASPLVSIVRHKSYLEGGTRWDDWRRGDVAAVPPQDVCIFWSAVSDFNEVVPDLKKKKKKRK